MLLTEVTEGIEGTGIRAGVIKLASGTVISPLERIFFTAAARVNRETGVPIITHTQLGTQGPEQAELLFSRRELILARLPSAICAEMPQIFPTMRQCCVRVSLMPLIDCFRLGG